MSDLTTASHVNADTTPTAGPVQTADLNHQHATAPANEQTTTHATPGDAS